jgi:hypothetical protein
MLTLKQSQDFSDRDVQRRLNMEYYKKIFTPMFVNVKFEVVDHDGNVRTEEIKSLKISNFE